MTPMHEGLAQAVETGQAGDRLWLYATYHCNLACRYCLSESHPRIANRRELPRATMIEAVREAGALGFASVGVTGGEVFMLPWFAEALTEVAGILPAVALTNGTLFTPRTLDRLDALSGLDVAFQLSLDSADPDRNDALRGRGNHTDVIDAISRLRKRGHRVRIATTVEHSDADDLERLCELHRSFGIGDDDHVVRAIVRRGKAAVEDLGSVLGPHDVLPELTLTSEGAFLHPFAPTVRRGQTDLDLRVLDAPVPVDAALEAFLGAVAELPAGDDVVRNVR
jgi:MoaA/NifB/PqqE/SkfB family radical SAM enzyme